MSTEKPKAEESEDDAITKSIGDFGKWQLTFTFLLSLVNFPCTWHIYALTFQGNSNVTFWCTPPPTLSALPPSFWRNISQPHLKNDDTKHDPCKIWDVDYSKFTPETILEQDFSAESLGTRECDRWTYDETVPDQSITSQWDLICNDKSMTNTAEMVFLAGVAFGGLISGFLSDRFGRKKTLLGSTFLQLLLGVSLAFVPWFSLYLVIRFFLGLICVSIVFTGFVLCMELVGGIWRTISGVCYIFPVSLGYIASAGIAYIVREWRFNQLAISLPSLLLFSIYWFIPESPRWLLTMGKVEENMKILTKAAKVNGRELPENIHKLLQQSSVQPSSNENGSDAKIGVLDLFRYPNIRRKSLVLFVIWFSVYFVYYGLVMNLDSLGGNIYINTVLSGAVEIPAILVSILILLKLGRRWPMGLTMILSGIVCTICSILGDGRIELMLVARFAISCSNIILPVYTAELFPTVVRNLGVGACNMSGGVAMVIVPYLYDLTSVAIWLPTGLLAAGGLVGGFVALTLPETATQPLINTLEEGEEWGRTLIALKNRPNEDVRGKFNQSFAV